MLPFQSCRKLHILISPQHLLISRHLLRCIAPTIFWKVSHSNQVGAVAWILFIAFQNVDRSFFQDRCHLHCYFRGMFSRTSIQPRSGRPPVSETLRGARRQDGCRVSNAAGGLPKLGNDITSSANLPLPLFQQPSRRFLPDQAGLLRG